jgi:hypothetical protein
MAMEMIMHTYDDVARELVDRLVTRARPNMLLRARKVVVVSGTVVWPSITMLN